MRKKEDTHKVQRVHVDDGKRGFIRNLYRFDLEEKECLHFFDKTVHSPEGLRKFCDDVLLVKHDDKTKQRLLSLDVLRGLTIAGMIPVNSAGTYRTITA